MNRLEIHMRTTCAFLLAAALTGPVHAECSGGEGGGIDATGNQCSTYVAGSGINALAQSDKMSGVHVSLQAAAPLIRSANMSVLSPTAKIAAAQASRIVRAAMPATPRVKTSTVENGSEAACSGGAGGGMDVNGNQCGEATALVGSTLVARK